MRGGVVLSRKKKRGGRTKYPTLHCCQEKGVCYEGERKKSLKKKNPEVKKKNNGSGERGRKRKKGNVDEGKARRERGHVGGQKSTRWATGIRKKRVVECP